jgi:hypothetical protein
MLSRRRLTPRRTVHPAVAAGLPGAPSGHKRDRHRRDGLALAPKIRIKDQSALERARSRGRCEWPGCPHRGRLDACHGKTKGSGGDDTDANLVGMCRLHHGLQESAGQAGKLLVRLIVKARTDALCRPVLAHLAASIGPSHP